MKKETPLDFDQTALGSENKVRLISAQKFAILFVLSFGLYGFWWMYKKWDFFKKKDLLYIMPFGRALFAIFFLWELFDRIQDYAKANGHNKSYSSGPLFIGILLVNLITYFSESYWIWLLSFASFVFYLPPNTAFNHAIENSEKYAAELEAGFSKRQWVIIVLGSLFWISDLIGRFLMGAEGYGFGFSFKLTH